VKTKPLQKSRKRSTGVTEDNFYSSAYDEAGWQELDESPYSEQYNESVWSEGKRRWENVAAAARDEQIKTRCLDFMLNEGVLDDESFALLLELRTSDAAMTARLTDSVRSDAEWLSESRLTETSLRHHRGRNSSKPTAEEREHPKVWGEASKRWSELSAEEQSAEKVKIKAGNGVCCRR
jgi:hypothetical protein